MQLVENNRNIALDILKMTCAFLVIVCHFGDEIPYLKLELGVLAVPIFMTLSFYFLTKKSSYKFDLKKRILRVLVPLTLWNIIYFIIYGLIFKSDITINDFFWQVLTGHSNNLNPPMWFLNNLILLILLFWGINQIFKTMPFIPFLAIMIIAYFLQYMNINYLMFSDLPFELKSSFGRLVEMLPFMSIGYFLAKFDILNYIKNQIATKGKYLFWINLIVCCGIFCAIKQIGNEHLPLIAIFLNGFDYEGISKALLALTIIFLFNSLPVEKISKKGLLFLSFFTKNTLGIYCIHLLVERILRPFLFVEYNFLYCSCIFLVSCAICFLLGKILGKNAKYLVQ